MDNLEVVSKNEVVYLAVKPYIVPDILKEIAPAIGKHHLIVSVAAGITIDTIEDVSIIIFLLFKQLHLQAIVFFQLYFILMRMSNIEMDKMS